MKLIKLLLFLSIASHGIFAMDLEPNKEQLPKPDFTEEQFEQELKKPKTKEELEKKAGKDVSSFKDTAKIIAQKIAKPAIDSIKQQGILGFVLDRAAPISPVVLSTDGKKVMSYDQGKKKNFLKVWNVQRGQLLRIFRLSNNFDYSIKDPFAFTHNGTKVMINDDWTLKLYDLKGKKSLVLKLDDTEQFSWSADGNRVALLQDAGIRIIDFSTRETIRFFSKQTLLNTMNYVFHEGLDWKANIGFDLNFEGNHLVITAPFKHAGIVSVDTGKLFEISRKQFQGDSIVFAPNKKRILIYSREGGSSSEGSNLFAHLNIWNLISNTTKSINFEIRNKPHTQEMDVNYLIRRAFFSLNGDIVLILFNKKIVAFDTNIGEILFTHHEQNMHNVLIMPNNKQIMVVIKEKGVAFVKLLDAKTGKLILLHRIPIGAQRPKIYGKAMDWLQSNLLPDQAEIIHKMYEANKKGERLAVTMDDAVRISKMPTYVKTLLFNYFGKLAQKKEALLTNIPQEKE